MLTALQAAQRIGQLLKPVTVVDHRPELVECDGTVHRLQILATASPDLSDVHLMRQSQQRTAVDPTAQQANQREQPPARVDASDWSMVFALPTSTVRSTPTSSVSFRTAALHSGTSR